VRILVVDDDPLSREAIEEFVREQLGDEVEGVGSPADALDRTGRERFDLVITDIRMPERNGIELIREIRAGATGSAPKFVLVTAYADVNSSIQALRLGVTDYLQKPVNVDELARAVNRVRRDATLGADVHAATTSESADRMQESGLGIVYHSRAMAQLVGEATRLATQPSVSVLIEGETGTGKEMIARLLHPGEGPFVGLNCAAIPLTLFESELFGYEDGAFTGARRGGAHGAFEMAEGGTLFLDEINEMPLPMQPKLLRALQEREFRRVGGGPPRRINARVVVASNEDLEALVAAGSFRADLYYRVAVGRLRLPPLRERADDIVPLAEHFLRHLSAQLGKSFLRIGDDARRTLLHYHWPGNVRELRNVIERAVIGFDGEELRAAHLPRFDCADCGDTAKRLCPGSVELPDQPFSLIELEREIVAKTMERFHGNKTRVAEYLGISRSALRSRLPD